MKWLVRALIGLLVCGTTTLSFALPKAQRYAVAKMTTPVLTTPDFQSIFGGPGGTALKTDACGQIAALEFVALPNTVFTVTGVVKLAGRTMYRVTTDEYPYPEPKGYYVDSRFVQLTAVKPPPRRRELPSREQITSRLLAAQGTPYVWGGNLARGVPQMLLFYPPTSSLRDQEHLHRWLLAGVDCSGLLYEVTDGFTPRNTESLLTYGQTVRIAGLSADKIIDLIKPLDLIVWKGHVIIVLDQERAIESKPNCRGGTDGVRLLALKDLLEDLLAKRMPVDEHCTIADQIKKSFVIRRWYGVVPPKGGKNPDELPFFVPK